MLLIRKARPLLWDQPSWRIRGGVVQREKENDEGGIEKGRKRGYVGGKERNRRGVVLGSTNQREDAIDRHVAPGWFNEFHEVGGEGSRFLARRCAIVIVGSRKWWW